jgi:HK97 gp10 family phage protein
MALNDEAFHASALKYFKSIEASLNRDVKTAAVETQNDAKSASPVDTGALRSGWQMRERGKTNGIEVEVFNVVPYAGYVEYGTRKQRAQPMLRPAVNKAVAKLKTKIRRY